MPQPTANLGPTADLVKGPLLELRRIAFYAELGASKPSDTPVYQTVWSFNVRALPANDETLKSTLASIDPKHLQDLELWKRLKEQLAQLNKWKAMEPWAQLDVGGATWSPWPFPHSYLSPETAKSSSWYRNGPDAVPDYVADYTPGYIPEYIVEFEQDALRRVRCSSLPKATDNRFSKGT
jgi:hypothetical protein